MNAGHGDLQRSGRSLLEVEPIGQQGDEAIRLAVEQPVEQVLDLAFDIGLTIDHGVIALAAVFLLRTYRALLHQAMQEGLDGRVRPGLAGLHLFDQGGE